LPIPILGPVRETLVADLAPLGIPVTTSWPDELVFPLAFITPPINQNYLTGGDTFHSFVVALDVAILVAHGDAAASLTVLENLIEQALLNTQDWNMIAVDAPAAMTVTENGAAYLGTVIHLSKSITLY
jgi:hypothetical protein